MILLHALQILYRIKGQARRFFDEYVKNKKKLEAQSLERT